MEDEENASFCERILADLDNIFRRDPNILEFDIIDVGDSTCNRSPVVYIDNHLGLEKWCIPHLYAYVYKKFLQFKLNLQRIDWYVAHQWTRILLFINPDLITAWNIRREVINNNVQTYTDDLKFTELVLIRKPKSASAFTYREWLLKGACELHNQLDEKLIENELQVTLDAASRYSRNYYAWSHRTWIFTVYLSSCNPQYIHRRTIDDLAVTEKWLEGHISDYSCFQHRQYLIGYLFSLESKFSILNLQPAASHILKELQLLNSLFPLYPEQETLFLHRRFLMHASARWCPDQLDTLYKFELDFYRDHIVSSLHKCSPSSWQRELIKRYLAYLKRNLNWSFEC